MGRPNPWPGHKKLNAKIDGIDAVCGSYYVLFETATLFYL